MEIIQTQTKIDGRLINLIFNSQISAIEYNLSAYYGLPNKNIRKQQFCDVINFLQELHKIEDNNIILGDFNFVENPLDKTKGLSQQDKMLNPYWKGLKSSINISDPFRIQYPEKRSYSFVNHTGRSRIDRVYANEENVHQIANLKYTHTPFNNAHKILTFEFRNNLDKGKGIWKMNSSVINDIAYVEMIQKTFENIEKISRQDDQEWWQIFIGCVRSKTVQ